MTKVLFKFDKKRDLQNLWGTVNKSSKFYDFGKTVSPKIHEICDGKSFDECKDKLEKNMSNVYSSGIFPPLIKACNQSWKSINDEFFKRMEKITKRKMCSDKFVAYGTTSGKCPYDPWEKSFMFSMFNGIPWIMQVSAHEIMHMQFHEYYWDSVEKRIGKEKTGDLKEALTVILNLEFKDLYFAPDRGYDSHAPLRKFIEQEWKKNKDFEDLIEKCVVEMGKPQKAEKN